MVRFFLFSFALALAACSSSNTTGASDASTDGESPDGAPACANPVAVDADAVPSSPGCPSSEPIQGTPCSPSGQVCHGYGALAAPITATCSVTCAWSLTVASPTAADASAE